MTLQPGVLTAVSPPCAFQQCLLGNTTGADLRRYTNDDVAANEYRLLATGFERLVPALKRVGFRYDEIAFWLLSAPGGEVILEWC
jgi:hypothetical protein